MPDFSLAARIKKIQQKLSVPTTGLYDLSTCNAIERNLSGRNIIQNLFEKKKSIQKLLGFSGRAVDGIFGVNTTTKIEMFLDEKLPNLPSGASMIISKKSLDLLREFEISSKSSYINKYKHPIWPEGESGITIGIGYDLGYATHAEFTAIWSAHLSNSAFNTLKNVVGLKGQNAKNALNLNVKSVEVAYESALEVFYTISVPKYAKSVVKIYPAVAALPPDAQGALLSLIYNRGNSLEGPRREEMRNMVAYVNSKNLKKIAEELRTMKRLWPKLRGLQIRREKEAILVENAKYFSRPEDYIFA